MPIVRVIDLKIYDRSEYPPVIQQEESTHVHRQTRFLSGHGLHAHAYLSTLCNAVSRRLQSEKVYLLRSIPLHGLCANHLPGKPARYRNLFACPRAETLSYGHSRQGIPINHCQRQRTEKLEDLCRSGLFADQYGAQALQRRILRFRVGTNGLCTRCHNHRLVPDHVSVGPVPTEQGSYQTPYITGFALQYPNFHSHLRRQIPRSQYARHCSLRTRVVLRYGSRLSGLLQIIQSLTGFRLLPDPCKIQSPMSENLLASGRSVNRSDLRSDDHAHRILSEQRLSRKTATCKILRRRNRSYFCLPDQQFQSAGPDNCTTLSLTLASGDLFQMDQTTPAHQKFLWNIGECGQNTNLDCHLRLRYRCHSEKTTSSPLQSLHYFTGSKRLSFRKSSALSTIYKNQLQNGKPYVV